MTPSLKPRSATFGRRGGPICQSWQAGGVSLEWVSEDGKHNGFVYAEVRDGGFVGHVSAAGWDVSDAISEVDVVAWFVGCDSCGWRGPRWERVTDPADADWDARRVYAGPEATGWAPPSVEEAGHQAWLQHL